MKNSHRGTGAMWFLQLRIGLKDAPFWRRYSYRMEAQRVTILRLAELSVAPILKVGYYLSDTIEQFGILLIKGRKINAQ